MKYSHHLMFIPNILLAPPTTGDGHVVSCDPATPGTDVGRISYWKVRTSANQPPDLVGTLEEIRAYREQQGVTSGDLVVIGEATTPADVAGALLSREMSRFMLEGNQTQSPVWLVQHNSPNRAQRRAKR